MAPQAPPKAPAKRPAPEKIPVAPCPPERYAEVGMIVVHYPDLAYDARPSLGVVTAMGMEAIDLLVFHPGVSGGWPQQGVYHREHQSDRHSTDGYWMPRPIDVATLRMMIAQGALEWDNESRYVPTKKAEAPTTPPSSPPVPPKA